MTINIATKNLLEEFNSFFEGDAEIIITDSKMEITVGSRTLVISLPGVISARATGLSQSPLDTHRHKL